MRELRECWLVFVVFIVFLMVCVFLFLLGGCKKKDCPVEKMDTKALIDLTRKTEMSGVAVDRSGLRMPTISKVAPVSRRTKKHTHHNDLWDVGVYK